MAQIDSTINANLHDASEKTGGAVDTDNDSIIIGSSKGFKHCGFIFSNNVVSIKDANIDDATLTFRPQASDSGGFSVTFDIENLAAPADFAASNNNITNRSLIGTSPLVVTGTTLTSWTAEGTETLDVTALIQSLANTALESSKIAIISIYGSGNGSREPYSHDNDSAKATNLVINYTITGGAELTASAAGTISAVVSPAAVFTAVSQFDAVAIEPIIVNAPAAEITSSLPATFVAATAEISEVKGPAAVFTAVSQFDAKPITPIIVTGNAGSMFSGELGFSDFGFVVRSINVADYELGVVFYLEATMQTDNALQQAEVVLVNVTASNSDVPGSKITTTSTTPDRVRSSSFGLVGSNEYKVQIGGQTGATYTIYEAQVIADWTRP